MGESLAELLGHERPSTPEWFLDHSDAHSCLWRRQRPAVTPRPLYSIVLLWNEEWSVSFAYQPCTTGPAQTRLEVELYDTLDAALTAVESGFKRERARTR